MDCIEAGTALTLGSRAHHLTRVVRLNPGEMVEVSDQKRAYTAVTESCSPDEVRFRLLEELATPSSSIRLDVALAIIKFRRFEWAVEKLTELGVHSITPLIASRCDTKLVSAAEQRLERWQRIAFEAAQQSRQLSTPPVEAPVGFKKFVIGTSQEVKILANAGCSPISQDLNNKSAVCLIGPEGGWSDEELSLARGNGFILAGLASPVLRSETAAIAMVAICTSHLA